MQELVSIITPAYNCSKFLEQAIQSVISQTYTNWEMLIVDDCSTDDTYKIAKEFAARDQRVRVFKNKKNKGPAITRNRAIKEASGRYIAFLDADDLWMPGKLEAQISFLQTHDVSFTFSHYSLISEEGENLNIIKQPDSQICYHTLLKSNQIGCLTAIYDSAKIGKVYMPVIRKRQDYGLWLKILKKVEVGMCVPEVLAKYRVRADSVSSNKLNLLKYNWQLFRKVENLSLPRSAYYLSRNIFSKLSDR